LLIQRSALGNEANTKSQSKDWINVGLIFLSFEMRFGFILLYS
jgi:hypothetical protein